MQDHLDRPAIITVPVIKAAAALEERLIKMVDIERIRYAHFREGRASASTPEPSTTQTDDDPAGNGLDARTRP